MTEEEQYEAKMPGNASSEKKESEKNPSKVLEITTYVFVLLMSVGLAIAGTNMYLTGRLPWDGFINQKEIISTKDIRRIQETYRTIMSNYVEDVDSQTLVTGAIQGMTSAIEDPYSQFLQGEQMEQLDQTIEGSFEGIGAEVIQKDGKIQIVSPIKDSPAEKAGLRANDFILAVDGQSVEGKTAQEAVELIRGESDTQVVLTIEREGQTQDVTITRGEIPIQTVHAELVADSTVGRIQITSFSNPTYDEVVEAIKSLREQGATAFILDVRGNPGGLLPSVMQVANIFLSDGDTIVKVQEKGKDVQTIAASDEEYGAFKVSEPVAVLVDEGSASASEILAGALQQSANVPIIGQATFGKGTVQSVIPVDDASDLKLTIAKWLTPDGTWINETGIQPDIEAKLPDYAQLSLIDTTKTYKQNDVSESVHNIESILAVLGYLPDDEVNNDYTAATTQAVKALQEAVGLTVTGEVNGETAVELIRQVQIKIQANDTQLERAVEAVEEQEALEE